MTDIEGRGAYKRSQFEGGADLNPTALHWGYRGQARFRGETIKVQVVMNEN